MKFIKKLKAKSILSTGMLALLLALAGLLFLASSQCWLFWQEPANLYDVPREELEGAYVTVELPRIFTNYAYTEEFDSEYDTTGTLVSMEYIIDANPDDYCGLLIDHEEMLEQANLLMEQTYQYNYYEIDEITATFTVTGVMEKMPSDSLDFYHEVVGYDQLSAAEQEIYLPLYLNVRDSGDVTTSVAFLIAAGVLFAIALFLLIRAFSGAYQKQILKKAEQLSPNAPDMILDQLEQLNESQPKEKIQFNNRLIFANNGNNSRLYAMNELVWAYHSVTTQRVYFIPVGKTNTLILAMIDGKRIQVSMKDEQVKEYLQKIYQVNPGCFFGYSDEVDKLYRKNPASLPQIRAAQMNTPQQ